VFSICRLTVTKGTAWLDPLRPDKLIVPPPAVFRPRERATRFDPSTKEMRFTMPFDWNVTRLEQNKVMVHQEIQLPKPSGLVAKSYVGTINGIDVTKNLMVDPTNSTKDVVHFMIPKPVVMQIAEQVNKSGQAGDGLMKFTFKPAV
jgi:hypothetical protein